MHTPNLNKLADEGIVFDNCISVSPVCQPARASFITGQYPYVNGVSDNFQWISPQTPVISDIFREAGWQTAAIGKMHFHPWNNPQGFEYRVIAEDKRHFFLLDDWTLFLERRGLKREHPATIKGYRESLGAIVSPLPEDYHIDSFIGEEAVKWIEQLEDRPFFGWISFNSPHDPYDPPENLADLYKNAPITAPTGDREELSSKPAYQQEIIPFFRDNLLYLTDYSYMDREKIRRMREYYLATITLVDRQIGRILDALERKGLKETTLIVFSSDHGDHLGDHGLPFKSTFYESALKVPLLISGPGVSRGERSSSFIDWLDLHVLFLKTAGLNIPEHIQGKDVSPLLESPSLRLREEAFGELAGAVMVTTERYKLVLCENGEGELYDLKENPPEVFNHFDDPLYGDVKEGLREKLLRHLLAHGRVKRFGGGSFESPPERKAVLEEIKRKIERGDYPGL